MIGFRASKEFKKFLLELADKENRTLTSFITNAILYYLKKEKGVDYKKNHKKP